MLAVLQDLRLKQSSGSSFDVLGEHREQAAHQEQRHVLGVDSSRFSSALRDLREAAGDVARDLGAMRCAGSSERGSVQIGAQALANVVDRAGLRGRCGSVWRSGNCGVVLALPGEVGVDLDAVPDIADDEERRPAVARLGSALGVVLRLPAWR